VKHRNTEKYEVQNYSINFKVERLERSSVLERGK